MLLFFKKDKNILYKMICLKLSNVISLFILSKGSSFCVGLLKNRLLINDNLASNCFVAINRESSCVLCFQTQECALSTTV